MNDITVHPSIKPILPHYLLSVVLFMIVVGWLSYSGLPYWWLVILPFLVALWAVAKHITLRTTRLVIEGDLIKYESGFASKQQRTIVIQKLQDVRVDQSVMERMFGIGSLTLETAGESSRLTIEGIDNPGRIAEMLHEKMQHHGQP